MLNEVQQEMQDSGVLLELLLVPWAYVAYATPLTHSV